ncbi:hypothetical protein [Mesorhizobium sp. M1A.F.Ca.ET.072.01.1.1]|uniref:hypothetical protein n=1 Tax=Mesorhizobium sp. M1A.F.Ca.ET.072.01.1.1 TaxID=2496753 RepID=UPI001676A403|nr:hypothetical protein [Mesorhizobium sp. M1A.F.Ca.ET.072.01.1.1]
MSEVALLVDERANDIGRMPLPGEIEALSLHALDRFRRSSAADYLKAQPDSIGHRWRWQGRSTAST